jgi:hypothetical protein
MVKLNVNDMNQTKFSVQTDVVDNFNIFTNDYKAIDANNKFKKSNTQNE